ncbi:sporulation-delaying protein SdpB family protein [Flavobacterium sp. WC2430]|uniref:sporulation-delaying protein SdpB family protein n=1 Tax=Flavobacterium sp. WC2430 TaxID=3234137 RepID=UPI003467B4FD
MKEHYNIIEKLINHNYWTNWLGFSRSLLAFSLLITLSLNNKTTLFYTGLQNQSFSKFNQIGFNIYSWFSDFNVGIIISIISLIIVISGIYPKYTCLLHWFVSYSFISTSTCSDGGDIVSSIITLLLIPLCLFDDRKWHWQLTTKKRSFFAKTIATISYYLISIQIFVIYFFAAIGKFKITEWQNGTAIYYWLTHPLFGVNKFFLSAINLILLNPILTAFLNWSVLLVELLIAFCLFSTNLKYRKIILIIGLFFHLCIGILMGIFSFSITMSSILFLFLISKNNNYGLPNFNINSSISYFNNCLSFPTKKN